MNILQRSDGTVQYQCNHCQINVIKKVGDNFNRIYKGNHKMCIDHEDPELSKYVPRYINEDGNPACNWCGYVM